MKDRWAWDSINYFVILLTKKNQKKQNNLKLKTDTCAFFTRADLWRGGGEYWSGKTCPFGNTLKKNSTNEIGNQFLDVIMAFRRASTVILHEVCINVTNYHPKAGQTKLKLTVKPGRVTKLLSRDYVIVVQIWTF